MLLKISIFEEKASLDLTEKSALDIIKISLAIS